MIILLSVCGRQSLCLYLISCGLIIKASSNYSKNKAGSLLIIAPYPSLEFIHTSLTR
jgi:hypothetical protein